MKTTILIGYKNGVTVGRIVCDDSLTESQIESIVNAEDGHMHDLMDLAGPDSTIPEDYEWTGAEVYEVME